MKPRIPILVALLFSAAGCGTTRWTDSQRTATEQLLISDAIDRSISRIDFHQLAGQDVYLDTSYLTTVVDKDYLVSSLHQHMLASGCTMKDKKDEADFVVEARAGAVGTDRHDLLFGMPSINLPWTPVTGTPAALPEIALAKRTDQKGVAKVAVFAYHRTTGEPVWQSGVDTIASKAQNSWWLGMGPLQKGTIYDKAQFAGREFRFPMVGKKPQDEPRTVRVTRETTFNSPARFALRSNDELSKFGEFLHSSSDSLSLAMSGNGDYGGPGSATKLPDVFASPAANWNVDPTLIPVGSQGAGPVLSSPRVETTPTARLLGPTRK